MNPCSTFGNHLKLSVGRLHADGLLQLMLAAVRLAAASDASYAKKLAELVEPYRNRDIEAPAP